ncbi:MAG TPA: 4Fe-4S dicluster domain-containing protein [Bacteroidales bacterium]|jgi:formate dehydrogenase iron-sulfur subunit|nr:4Fe-4S dicluster domain-containing protein [Bacteroidales bacterium]
MSESILIDMIKLRSAMTKDPSAVLPDAHFYGSVNMNGLKTIRELATFRFTCRRCEEAPCIAVCPADALEKDKDGIIDRHTNLCVSCKSCVSICPFGTMMTDFFKHHRNRDLLYDLKDEKDVEKFIKACPEGVVTVTDIEESPERNIHRLNEKVLIRDYLYKKN